MDRACHRRGRGPALSPGRLTLLLTTPRLAPGLLSRAAWLALGAADVVLARSTADPQPAAVVDAGVPVAQAPPGAPAALARTLLQHAADAQVVWVGSPDADPGLADALAGEVARSGSAPQIEVLIGSWDTPGARLLDAVAVMDRLRSPGGCPWDAEQTHQSLVPYLLEEAHEAVEALESEDRAHMAEELGDVLLQVLFHARVAEEDASDPFDIDEVAGQLVAKLVRRHPHVFADAVADGPAAVEASWERIKASEKPDRAHLLAGIPAGMPELARAAKVAARVERAGRTEALRAVLRRERAAAQDAPGGADHAAVAADLMEVVLRSAEAGVDPAAALRALLRRLADEPEVSRPS